MCDKLIKVTSLILNITRIAIYIHTLTHTTIISHLLNYYN